jgi:hypothetical protein
VEQFKQIAASLPEERLELMQWGLLNAVTVAFRMIAFKY